MRLRLSTENEQYRPPAPTIETMIQSAYQGANDEWPELKRSRERRSDDEDSDCEESDDENEDKSSSTTKASSSSSLTVKSKCLRSTTTGLPAQATPTQLRATTALIKSQQSSLTASSISSTTMFTAASFVPTSITQTLSKPSVTAAPSGIRKNGSGPQAVMPSPPKSSLSSRAETALIAFGAIIGIAVLGFAIFATLRCMKRKRSEASAYDDLEPLYRSDHAASSVAESANITRPPNVFKSTSNVAQKFQLPPIFQSPDRSWSFGRSRSSQTLVNPATDPGSDLFPPLLSTAVVRKPVRGVKEEDPFQDPEMDELDCVTGTVRKFHTTPSWVMDQAERIRTAR